MQNAEPCFDVAHLGHVEMLTNKPQESLDFFVRILGLTESGREGDSVYLRAYDDYEFHTLKLTASNTTGKRHVGYRASSPQALQRRVAAIEALGAGIGWTDGDLGHGPAYQFRDPDGHVFEIYYETQRYVAPEAERPALKNQPQRNHQRGAAVRRLDHFNLLAGDVGAIRDFMPKALGSRVTEQIVLDNGQVAGCWFTVNNKSYDVAYTRDTAGGHGRFHHITYAVDQREHVLEAADVFLENGVLHRDRSAQARHPADVLPVRLRAGRQPGGGGQRRRPSHPGARQPDGDVDGDRAQKGPGLGPEDHRELPHARHAAAAGQALAR